MKILSRFRGALASLAILFCLNSSTRAEFLMNSSPISQRMNLVPLKVEEIFHEAQDEFDHSALKAGQSYFWIRYGKKPKISKSSFKGYVLNADPYHVAQKRISFLLGSDCSHFVHRIFQLLGANFSYTKTRSFMEWAEKGRVSEWNDCRNQEFAENFQLVAAPSMDNLHLGDILVWPRSFGERGWHGHAVIVSGLNPPTILHAKNHRRGIVMDVFDESLLKGAKALRWVGGLEPRSYEDWSQLLKKEWPRDPSRCAL